MIFINHRTLQPLLKTVAGVVFQISQSISVVFVREVCSANLQVLSGMLIDEHVYRPSFHGPPDGLLVFP